MDSQSLKNLEDFKKLGDHLGDGRHDNLVRPSWLNLLKLEKGQKLAQKNIFYIYFWYQSILLNGFAIDGLTDVLDFTGNRNVNVSRRRLVKVFLNVETWMTSSGDIFDPANECYKSLLKVRKVHNLYRKKFEKALETGALTDHPVVDAEDPKACPFQNHDDLTPISQFDLCVIQMAFVSTLFYWNCIHKDMFSQEDLKDWIYLWRCFGYLLGIEDEMNICSSYEQAVHIFEEAHFKNSLDLFFRKPTEKQLVLSSAYCQGIPLPIRFLPRISVYSTIKMTHFILQNYPGRQDLVELPSWVEGHSSLARKFNFYYFRVLAFVLGYLPYPVLDGICSVMLSSVKSIKRRID